MKKNVRSPGGIFFDSHCTLSTDIVGADLYDTQVWLVSRVAEFCGKVNRRLDDPISAIGRFLWPQRDSHSADFPANSFILPNFSPRTQNLPV